MVADFEALIVVEVEMCLSCVGLTKSSAVRVSSIFIKRKNKVFLLFLEIYNVNLIKDFSEEQHDIPFEVLS